MQPKDVKSTAKCVIRAELMDRWSKRIYLRACLMVQRCPSESAHLGTLRSIACVEGRKVDDGNVVKLGVLLCGLFVGQFDVLWRHVCTMRWLEVILWTHNKSDDVVNDVHDFLRPLIVGSRVRPVQIRGYHTSTVKYRVVPPPKF